MALSLKLDELGEKFGVPKLFHPPDGPEPRDQQFDGSFVARITTGDIRGRKILGAIVNPNGGFLVGFSPVCTHMGCLLVTTEDDGARGVLCHKAPKGGKPETLVCGPCPCHGTSFDLLLGGLVVLGPATQNLAQLKLELNADKTQVKANGWIENDRQHSDPRVEDWPYIQKDKV